MAVIVCLAIYILAACTNSDKVAPINPNGDSELAILMRNMFDDAMRMKKAIESGDRVKVLEKFKKMHTAAATEPEKVASPMYKVFTDAYYESLTTLENVKLGETAQAFNSMVQSCMNCHQAMCPGPMVRIEKLWIDTGK